VDGDHRPRAEQPRRRYRLVGAEREQRAPEAPLQARAAGVQDRDLELADAVDDAGDDVDGGVVAAYVDGRQAVDAQHEADDRTGQVIGAVRAVLRGHGQDRRCADGGRLPRLESGGGDLEAPCARRRREHVARTTEVGATGRVEVLGVVVVREQDDVDVADLVLAERRPRELVERGSVLALVVAGRVEGGIGDPPQLGVLDERGGAADERGGERMRGHRASVRRAILIC
jgi:hypothetical protein